MRLTTTKNLRGGGRGRLKVNRYVSEPAPNTEPMDGVGLGIRNNLDAINAKEARWHEIYAHLGNGSNGDGLLVAEADQIEEEVDLLWAQRRRALQVLEQAYFKRNGIEHSTQTINQAEYMEPLHILGL